jgi:threonine dehydratase
MPKGTPTIKVRNVARLGAKVVLHGADFDEAKGECARLAAAHGLVFVPPYDDPLVIAGQGTVGMEILKQLPNAEQLDSVFSAVGGGGLVAGICEYIKRIGSPDTRVIGVETFDGDAMARSLEKGERVTLPEVGPFSDGTAVRIVGEEPFRICQQLLDRVVKVDNDEICAAIKDIFEGASRLVEMNNCFNSGVAGGDRDPVYNGTRRSSCLGRLEKVYIGQPTRQFWKEICGRSKWSKYELRSTTICGGTCSARRRSGGPAKRGHSRTTRQVRHAPSSCHRAAFEPRHDVLSLVSFFELHTVIHPRQVTEFIYRYNAPDRAHVFLSFQLESSSRAKEVASVLDELERGGMNGHDISDDEMAKSHARYLIGGASDVPNERIFRFGTIHSPRCRCR